MKLTAIFFKDGDHLWRWSISQQDASKALISSDGFQSKVIMKKNFELVTGIMAPAIEADMHFTHKTYKVKGWRNFDFLSKPENP